METMMKLVSGRIRNVGRRDLGRFARAWALIAFACASSLATIAGCEGEPPVVVPENTLSSPALTPGAATPSDPQAGQATRATPCAAGAPNCPPSGAAAPAANASAASAGSPASPAGPASASGASAPAEPAAPQSASPAAARGSIIGTVTTVPAALKGSAIVYLEDGPQEEPSTHSPSATVDNRKMTFAPFVSVVPAGGKVTFTNDDPFPHNVFSPDNDKFNMGSIAQGGAHVRAFKNPGAYTLLCNLHPGMLGYLLVTPSHWFVRTDAKGTYKMKDVPSGTYKVTAWAPRQSPVTQSVAVTEGEVTRDFDLHR
jgi:plastocyanin